MDVITVVAKIMDSTSADIEGGMKTFKGVQQGAVLSPSLYNIYFDTLLKELEASTVSRHAWADDLAFVCHSQNDLETALTTVNKWCSKMGMLVNKEKSGILAIRVDKRTPAVRQKAF